MNKIFTKEQIQVLKEFEQDMHTVLDLKYKRNNTRADLDKMACIYEECTGVKISREYSCPQCQFNLVAKVGELYRKSVAYWEAEDAKQEEVKEEVKVEETVEETPKKTRSKKSVK